MDYDTNLMPETLAQWEQLIDDRLAKEEEKAAADPLYIKQTRKEIELTYSCYYPHPEPEQPLNSDE